MSAVFDSGAVDFTAKPPQPSTLSHSGVTVWTSLTHCHIQVDNPKIVNSRPAPVLFKPQEYNNSM